MKRKEKVMLLVRLRKKIQFKAFIENNFNSRIDKQAVCIFSVGYFLI